MMVDLPISSTACRYGEITWDAAAGKAGGSHAGRSDSAAADIGKSLAVYGEWREREIVFLSQFLAPGAAVLDVGAGIGALALGFARRVAPGGRVLAVEPRAAEAAILAGNVARNAPDVVVVASLDEVAAARPALVRIDEATDPAALVAAFAAGGAVIAIAIASLAAAASAFRHLEGSGRRLWFADFAAFNPENFRAVPGNVLGFRHDAVLLALPAAAADPEPATARVLAPVADLEGFAGHFLRMPRARAATLRERDLDVLRQRLAEIEAGCSSGPGCSTATTTAPSTPTSPPPAPSRCCTICCSAPTRAAGRTPISTAAPTSPRTTTSRRAASTRSSTSTSTAAARAASAAMRSTRPIICRRTRTSSPPARTRSPTSCAAG